MKYYIYSNVFFLISSFYNWFCFFVGYKIIFSIGLFGWCQFDCLNYFINIPKLVMNISNFINFTFGVFNRVYFL